MEISEVVHSYQEAEAQLLEGRFVRCMVQESNMRPFLKEGVDEVLLCPMVNSGDSGHSADKLLEKHNKVSHRRRRNSSVAEGRTAIRRRSIVLCRTNNTHELKLMRVVHVWGTLLLLRGDASYGPYESATVSDIVGVVLSGTYMGGRAFRTTSKKWRYSSKAWTVSYKMRKFYKKINRHLLMLCVLVSALATACTPAQEIIHVQDCQFIRHGEPYYFIGTNFWYGPILASDGAGGDRARLARELDSLKAMGIENLRVLVGADGARGVYTKVEPTLQYAPGEYNDTLLRGLDYFMAELGKRDMEAVLYLNNAWEWSGGYSQYLQWAGHGDIPLPRVAGYDAYVDYAAQFIPSDSARAMFADYVRDIVSRTNHITGKPYSEDPAIFSWQICNEPRPFSAENKPAFAAWLRETAALIKSIDPNHMVSVGSEGKYGCHVDLALWEEIGGYDEIDYLNIHIWPHNWGWTTVEDMNTGNIQRGVDESLAYLAEHLEVAERIGKPLVVEEFGFPRDGKQFSRNSPVTLRDTYYKTMLETILPQAASGGILAGFNFWGWGGYAEPSAEHLMWQPGDDYTGDPAQEEQGLYSVFATDCSTVEIIKTIIDQL